MSIIFSILPNNFNISIHKSEFLGNLYLIFNVIKRLSFLTLELNLFLLVNLKIVVVA